MVVTKETAVGEVMMKSMSHPECRADTAADEPAMKTIAPEPTAVRDSPTNIAGDDPTTKTAAAEPAAVRSRLRRGR
jgi:hypothetical protein